MKFSFGSIGDVCATFVSDTEIAKGVPVKLIGNGAVAKCADGDEFIGIVTASRGNLATVQLKGFAEVPYSGTAPALGWQGIAAAASGKVKASATAIKRLVADVDTVKSTVTVMM